MKIALVSIPVEDPLHAHKFYTEVLGFVSREFDPDAKMAIVASSDDPNETTLFLEPSSGSFYEDFQTKAYTQGLPVMVMSDTNLEERIETLKNKGVVFRDDLTRKEWGLENIFEDTCGNLLMLQKAVEVA